MIRGYKIIFKKKYYLLNTAQFCCLSYGTCIGLFIKCKYRFFWITAIQGFDILLFMSKYTSESVNNIFTHLYLIMIAFYLCIQLVLTAAWPLYVKLYILYFKLLCNITIVFTPGGIFFTFCYDVDKSGMNSTILFIFRATQFSTGCLT